MKRRILAAILCCMLATAGMQGCGNTVESASSAPSSNQQGGESSQTAKPVTLDFLYWADEAQTKLVQEACRSYESQNPGVTIREQALPADGTFDQYIQAAKEKGTLPNISYMGEGDIQKYNEMGILADISDIFSDGTVNKKLDCVTIKDPSGKIIGVGLSNQMNLLYYSKSKLKKAGIETPPTDVSKAWDWDTFVKNCKKLTTDSNGKSALDAGFDPKLIENYGLGFMLARPL